MQKVCDPESLTNTGEAFSVDSHDMHLKSGATQCNSLKVLLETYLETY